MGQWSVHGVFLRYKRSKSGLQAEYKRFTSGVQAEYKRSTSRVKAEFKQGVFNMNQTQNTKWGGYQWNWHS